MFPSKFEYSEFTSAQQYKRQPRYCSYLVWIFSQVMASTYGIVFSHTNIVLIIHEIANFKKNY